MTQPRLTFRTNTDSTTTIRLASIMVTTLDQISPKKRMQRHRRPWYKPVVDKVDEVFPSYNSPRNKHRSSNSSNKNTNNKWWKTANARVYLSALVIVFFLSTGGHNSAEEPTAPAAAASTTTSAPQVATTTTTTTSAAAAAVPSTTTTTSGTGFCPDCQFSATPGATTCQQRVKKVQDEYQKPENLAKKVVAMVQPKACCSDNGKDEYCPPAKVWCPDCRWYSAASCASRMSYLHDTYGQTEDSAKESLFLEANDFCSRKAS